MDSSGWFRLAGFLSIFAVMACAEIIWPARQAPLSRWLRWRTNLSMVVLGTLTGRVLLPATLVGVALMAEENGWGLLHHLSWPVWLAITLSLLWLDLVIYWQHRLFHRIPWLWRIHKMHHADSHIDVTTGLRFHPVEIAISLVVKAAAIIVAGAPAISVVIFEIALNGFSIFNHTNIRLPQRIDDALGRLIITQRLHRIHHSQYQNETDTNFGFSVSLWDRLFRSFKSRALQPDETLRVGQQAYPPTRQNNTVWRLLTMPLDNQVNDDTKSADGNATDDFRK
ncbi:sterol desaturase family protein [Salinimonas sp. HHU 13199]|uniref:Sterol desaturase family protein n=1 Tax=Salinimonas profundi TaxID=2729140 RepID=A0ABR8LLK8_9ALTE|nr:sterol desaturase family protein [Salinimonas profundi]MBD3584814.1 sterol desaturase family protein [Salinimonas profundi]